MAHDTVVKQVDAHAAASHIIKSEASTAASGGEQGSAASEALSEVKSLLATTDQYRSMLAADGEVSAVSGCRNSDGRASV